MRRPGGERALQPRSPGCSAARRRGAGALRKTAADSAASVAGGFLSPFIFFLGAGGLSGVAAGGSPEPHVERLLEVRAEGCFHRRRRKRCSGFFFLGGGGEAVYRGLCNEAEALRPRFAAGAGVPGRGMRPGSREQDVLLRGAAPMRAACPTLRPQPVLSPLQRSLNSLKCPGSPLFHHR